MLHRKSFLNISIKVSSDNVDGHHPVDYAIKQIYSSLFSNFTKIWTNHSHKEVNKNCNKVLVLDGNFKCNRLKCTFDNLWKKSEEFGECRIGCPKTPQRLSYYCVQHKEYELEFSVENEIIKIQPKDIKISRISKRVYFYPM